VTSDPEAVEFTRAVVGVEAVDAMTARGRTDFGVVERGGLFGGQMMSQALAACAHTVPEGSVPDSIHANLLSGGRSGVPIEYRVERVRDGRALQHRDVRGYQDGTLIVHAAVVSSVPAAGAAWQSQPPRPVPPPQRQDPGQPVSFATTLGWGAFEVLHPDGHEAGVDSWLPLWQRSVTELPADPWLHGAILVFWSDYGMNGVARATHDEFVEEGTSSVSATHSVWIHRHSNPRDWHVLDASTKSLSGNQGYVDGTLHDAPGDLVASFGQGVFIRRPRQ
jgi:acyl-CoA thioesterase